MAVFCRCGAYWLGKVALDNPIIDAHRARCGPMLTALEYERLGLNIKWPQWWSASERRDACRWAANEAAR